MNTSDGGEVFLEEKRSVLGGEGERKGDWRGGGGVWKTNSAGDLSTSHANINWKESCHF